MVGGSIGINGQAAHSKSKAAKINREPCQSPSFLKIPPEVEKKRPVEPGLGRPINKIAAMANHSPRLIVAPRKVRLRPDSTRLPAKPARVKPKAVTNKRCQPRRLEGVREVAFLPPFSGG